MRKTVSHLLGLIEKQTKMKTTPFAEGIGTAEVESFTSETNLHLPKDYEMFLRVCNGQLKDPSLYFPPGQLMFLQLEEALDLWRELKAYESEDASDGLEDDRRVRAVTYHSSRFPIAYYESGMQYIFLDYSPGDRGSMGQLIFNPYESSFVVIAKTFSELLRDYIRLLEGGLAVIVKQPPEYGDGYWFETPGGDLLTFDVYTSLLRK